MNFDLEPEHELLRELAHGRADELVLGVEVEIQMLSRWASSTISRTP